MKLIQKDRIIFDKYGNDLIKWGILINDIIEADNKKRFFKVINSYSFERGKNILISDNEIQAILNFLKIYLIVFNLRCNSFSQYTYSYKNRDEILKWLFYGDNIKNRTGIFNGLIFNFINIMQEESEEKRTFAIKCRETLAPFLPT